MSAHCIGHGHGSCRFNRAAHKRPLGALLAWLLYPEEHSGCDTREHGRQRGKLCAPDAQETRQFCRETALDGDLGDMSELFELEKTATMAKTGLDYPYGVELPQIHGGND